MLLVEITVYYRFETRLSGPAQSRDLNLPSPRARYAAGAPRSPARPLGSCGLRDVTAGGRRGAGLSRARPLRALMLDLTRPSPGLRFLPYW